MSSHEKTPFDLENARTPEKSFLDKEREPSHQAKLEILYPYAAELVKAHQQRKVVSKVEALLATKSFDEFTEQELTQLAREYGSDEIEMIEAIAMALNGEKP